MVKLVVIADDFTGALDTGIKFAQTGAKTQMMIGTEFELTRIKCESDVLIVDSETRHLQPEKAYDIIYELVKRLADYGVEMFYKKTDSALRGCVGSEIAGMSDALGCRIHFVPALPEVKRVTKNGIHYIDGVPVSKSIFGKDPFEPVRKDSVLDIIKEQSSISVVNVKTGDMIPATDSRTVLVYDAEKNEDIAEIAVKLKCENELHAVAGCSGLADVMKQVVEFDAKEIPVVKEKDNIFIACGTVNEITGEQLKIAEEKGFKRISLTIEQKLKGDYLESAEGEEFIRMLEEYCNKETPVILDVFSEKDVVKEAVEYCRLHGMDENGIREKVADRLGEILEKWMDFQLNHVVILSGGDTVYGFLKRIECDEVYPVCEILRGAVLFEAKMKWNSGKISIVSKAGGLGKKDFFVKMYDKMVK